MATLLEWFTEKKDTYAALRDDARLDLSEVAADLADTRADYDALLADLAAFEKQIKQKRRDLAAAPMPADIEAMAGELRDLLGQARHARADLLVAEEQIAALQSGQQLAADQLKRHESNLKEAAGELVAAIERQTQHENWDETVSEGVLTDLAGKASALLDVISLGGAIDPEDPLVKEKETVAEAKQRVNGDIPASLVTRALARGQHLKDVDTGQAGLLADLKQETGLYWEATDGVFGKASKLWMAFLQSEDSYRELVLQAPSRYAQAQALLSAITKSAALTDAEKARITDAGLVSDGEAAIPLEAACEAAEAAVAAKQLELELAIAKTRIQDLEADPEDDTTVQSIRAELGPLETTLASAESAYTAAHQDNLDLWEAAIPDHIWANLAGYDEALALLSALRDADPAALATAMNSAEADLADGLAEEDVCLRTNDFLEDTLAQWDQCIEFAASKRKQRILGAIRGD